MSVSDFWMFSAEMRGREPDATRTSARAMEQAQDVGTPQADWLPAEMPTTYSDRNRETTGAVTAS
jgi:hypothetical protein